MKICLKKYTIAAPLLVIGLTVSSGIRATTYSANFYDTAGSFVTTCSVTHSDLKPLSNPQTLLVDNGLSNNTVIYSWNYGQFIPSVSLSCSAGSTGLGQYVRDMVIVPLVAGDGVLVKKTNNPGLIMKYYFTFLQEKGGNSGSAPARIMQSSTSGGSSWNAATVGQEYSFDTGGDVVAEMNINQVKTKVGNSYIYNFYPDNKAEVQIRADLVKVGDVSYGLPLVLERPAIGTSKIYEYPPMPTFSIDVGSGGTVLASPAGCRLKTKDYSINMSRWVVHGPGSINPQTTLPAYGSPVPVDLTLECSGKTNNVRFKFEDASVSPLPSHNIRLSDNIGGDKIDGLEIEMLYNGNHIDVDNTTEINTGSQGEVRTVIPSNIMYYSTSNVSFTARYIQRAAITKNGNHYTGPITGKINMWVTYD